MIGLKRERKKPKSSLRKLAYAKKYRTEHSEKIRKYMKKWREKNKHKMSAMKRKYTYGLTEEDFNSMLVLQESKCKICKRELNSLTRKSKPSVDHDHVTGEIRSLLCGHCNPAIGELQDDPEIILAAYNYVKYWKGGQDASEK